MSSVNGIGLLLGPGGSLLPNVEYSPQIVALSGRPVTIEVLDYLAATIEAAVRIALLRRPGYTSNRNVDRFDLRALRRFIEYVLEGPVSILVILGVVEYTTRVHHRLQIGSEFLARERIFTGLLIVAFKRLTSSSAPDGLLSELLENAEDLFLAAGIDMDTVERAATTLVGDNVDLSEADILQQYDRMVRMGSAANRMQATLSDGLPYASPIGEPEVA